jgi:predicted enzyme related to lactoylglutathione lyase
MYNGNNRKERDVIMRFGGLLISVSDMEKSKYFYEEVMEQKVGMDLGVHVSFESGLALQSNYEELVGEKLEMHAKPNNFQLYFEVEDLDAWEKKLSNTEGIEFIHHSKEYPWGQRVMRIYDYDKYIVEVSESMESVAKRYLRQGLSAEETAQRTMFPIEFVRQLL